MAWSKISEPAKKAILGTPDNEKGRDSNPIVVINNHEMSFEDEEEDDIAAQSLFLQSKYRGKCASVRSNKAHDSSEYFHA